MLFRLFLLFTLVPLAELALLLRISDAIGFLPALALVIGTGAAGAFLARREGMRSWAAVQAELASGRVPADALTHSLLILLAGVVLVTPGVLTDLAGLLLLIPPVRTRLIRALRARFERAVERGSVRFGPLAGGPGGFGMGWGAGGPFGGGGHRSSGAEESESSGWYREREIPRSPPRIDDDVEATPSGRRVIEL